MTGNTVRSIDKLDKNSLILICKKLNIRGYSNKNKDVLKEILKKDSKENKTSETMSNLDVNHPGALKAPMVGTAYVSPEPGKAPFIRLGDTVSNNQPLLIIEAMKVMNEIQSEFNGEIVEILVEDGESVEYSQPLFKFRRA